MAEDLWDEFDTQQPAAPKRRPDPAPLGDALWAELDTANAPPPDFRNVVGQSATTAGPSFRNVTAASATTELPGRYAAAPTVAKPSLAQRNALRREIGLAPIEASRPGDLGELLARGVAGVPELLGDLVELPSNVGGAVNTALGGVASPTLFGLRSATAPLVDVLQEPARQADAVGFGAPSVSGAQVVEALNPQADVPWTERLGRVGAFVPETLARSGPESLAAVGAMPAYLLARTNQIAETRAENDQRPRVSLGDLGAAVPAAVIESALERFTTGRLLPGGGATTAKTALGRVGQETAVQAPLGGLEELAPYLAEALGTEAGASPQGALEAFVGGLLAEGALGGTVQGGRELLDAAGGKRQSQVPTAVPTPAPLGAVVPQVAPIADVAVAPEDSGDLGALLAGLPEPLQDAAAQVLADLGEAASAPTAATPAQAPSARPAPAADGTDLPTAPAAPRLSGADAGRRIDARLAALEEAGRSSLPAEQVAALRQEGQELDDLLREHDQALAAGVNLQPAARLTADERAFIDNRRLEIRQALEQDRTASGARQRRERLQSRLGKLDRDADLDRARPAPEQVTPANATSPPSAAAYTAPPARPEALDGADAQPVPADAGRGPDRVVGVPARAAVAAAPVAQQRDRLRDFGYTPDFIATFTDAEVAAELASRKAGGPPLKLTQAERRESATSQAEPALDATAVGQDAADGAVTEELEEAALSPREREVLARGVPKPASAGALLGERRAPRVAIGATDRDGQWRVLYDDNTTSPGWFNSREEADAMATVVNTQAEDRATTVAEIMAERSRRGGEEDAARLGIRAAVEAAVGDAPVTYLRGPYGLPEAQRRGLEERQAQRRGRGQTTGLFHPGSGRVYLFTDAVHNNPQLAAFAAAHEIAGHKGLRALLGDQLNPALDLAGQNPTVATLANRIAVQRSLRPDQRRLAIEEALAELAAAVRTGDYAQLQRQYRLEVPAGIRQRIRTTIETFLARLKALFARQGVTFSDEQVRELLEAAWQAVDPQARVDAVVEQFGDQANEAAISEPDSLEAVRTAPAEAEARAEQRRTDLAATLPQPRGPAGWDYDGNRWEGRSGQLKRLRSELQDKMLAWRDTQDQLEAAGRIVEDAQNVYRLENLMHGRVADAMTRLEREQLTPLTDAMRAAKVTADQLDEYLMARHAAERNAYIAGINPAMPDGGSGLSNAEAADILAKADTATLEPLAQRVDALIAATRRRMREHGLITQAQFDAMQAQYRHYVPLRGQTDPGSFSGDLRGSRGVDTRASMVTQALGRGTGNRAQHVLGEVVGDAQRSLILAEKARVGRAVLRLVLANPNPTLWTVEPVQTERTTDAAGEVYDRVVTDWSDPNTVAVRHQGQVYRVRFERPELAQALNHVGVDRLGPVTRVAGMLNRYFSAVLTKYNPAFVPVNASRDALFGLTGLAVEHGEAAALDAALHYPLAARAAWRHSRGQTGRGDWDRWAGEFAAHGGKTGYVNLPSAEDLARQIGNLALDGPRQRVVRAAQPLLEVIGHLNEGVENALRLAAYVTLRKRGTSADAAAEYAKNLTVNFNRKGFAGSKLNAWFLFYNAGLQGAHRTSKLLRSPKTYAYLGTLAAAQTIATLAALGMEDEQGTPLWDKVPEHVKRRNLVIVLPDQGLITVPMPYGFNLFPYLAGRITAAMANGESSRTRLDDRAGSLVADALSAAAESFVPVPVGDGPLGLLPTVARIPANIVTNRDDFGRGIHRETLGKFEVPLAALGKPDTLEVFKLGATGLNRLGGGDAYTPPPASAFDLAPEDLEYLLKELTGGTGKFVLDVATVGGNALDPNARSDLSRRDVPILNRFSTTIDQQAAERAAFYSRRDTINRSLERVKDVYQAEGEAAASRMLATLPELTGAAFKRRKRDGANGQAGAVLLNENGAPQFVTEDERAVFGRYKAAEAALEAHRSAVRAVYGVAPATLVPTAASRARDATLRTDERVLTAELKTLSEAWQRDVVGFADRTESPPTEPRRSSVPESRRATYVGIGPGGTATPAPAVLAGARHAPELVMVGDHSQLPEAAVRDALDGGALGVYSPKERKAYVVMGLDPAEAKFVAYHEIAGHHGLQGALGAGYEAVLNRAMQNPTVDALAAAMGRSGYRGQARLDRVEEALAELAAARRADDYARIEQRWGVKVPPAAQPGVRGMLERVVQRTKRTLADLTGDEPAAYDDEQVYGLIADAWRYVESGERRAR